MVIKTLKDFSVPEEENCIFTRPDFKDWPALLMQNKASLSAVNDRDAARTELVNIANEYTRQMGLTVPDLKSAVDIVVTGHQPNWHHCGIFAKNIITDKFAKQINGTAIQLVLDHDVCGTSLSLPDPDAKFLRLKSLPLEKKHIDIPLEFRSVPSNEQLAEFLDSILKNSQNSFCHSIWHQDLTNIIDKSRYCRNIADTITYLQALLNIAFGLNMIYLPVSLMSQSKAFANFICSIICNSRQFVSIYNKAIKNKIQSDNLKSHQTVKALRIDYLNNIAELPFWLVSKTGKRASLYASIDARNLTLGTIDNVIGTLNSSKDKHAQLCEILKNNEYVIRPKAVTLTLFARLYLADLFVHGIGTDYIIKNLYNIKNTSFGIATATMTLPVSTNCREFFFGLFPKERLKKLICS